MSLTTEAELVPYKVNVLCGNNPSTQQTGFPALDALFHYLEHTTYEHEVGSKRGQPLPKFIERGWILNPESEYGNLFTSELVKDKRVVHYVNESENAVGGAENTSFFSDKKEDLEKLCDDWGFDKSTIISNKAVKQTF